MSRGLAVPRVWRRAVCAGQIVTTRYDNRALRTVSRTVSGCSVTILVTWKARATTAERPPPSLPPLNFPAQRRVTRRTGGEKFQAAHSSVAPRTDSATRRALLAGMVGALALARAVNDEELSAALLRETREFWTRTLAKRRRATNRSRRLPRRTASSRCAGGRGGLGQRRAAIPHPQNRCQPRVCLPERRHPMLLGPGSGSCRRQSRRLRPRGFASHRESI